MNIENENNSNITIFSISLCVCQNFSTAENKGASSWFSFSDKKYDIYCHNANVRYRGDKVCG